MDDSTVAQAAAAHLASRERPALLSGWSLDGAGTPDGRTAVVRLTGTARIPVISAVLDGFGGGVTITVESTARSDLVP